MSAPEVDAPVAHKYEIKRRLGKGVSAGGRGGAARGAAVGPALPRGRALSGRCRVIASGPGSNPGPFL